MAMTVQELIEQLSQQPMDAKVRLEGCDCINPSAGVERLDDDVLITAEV